MKVLRNVPEREVGAPVCYKEGIKKFPSLRSVVYELPLMTNGKI